MPSLAAVLMLGLLAQSAAALEWEVEIEPGMAPMEAEGPQVGWMRLSRPLADSPPPFTLTGDYNRELTLRGVISQLHHVATSDAHEGVVLYLDGAPLSMTQVQELGTALKRISDAGKHTVVFAEAYSLGAYLLACHADTIALQRRGMVELTGLGMEEMYLTGLLEKVGVKADLMQRGDYKGAAEPLTRNAPSEQWSRTIDSLLDDIYDHIIETIAGARDMDREGVESVMKRSLQLSDEEYVDRNVIDAVVARDLRDLTEDIFGEEFHWDPQMGLEPEQIDADNPFAIFQMLMQPPQPQMVRPTIGLMHMHGPIHSGDSGQAGLFSEDSVGSRTIVRALAEVRDEPMIQGLVIRIDSPGGSPIASDVIWQAIREVGREKPVFVSIGSTAASGGYYVAAAGDRIYASPSSILGSIGVVGGKIVLGGLYDMAGIEVHRRSRGPMGDMFNTVEPFTDEQREALGAAFDRIYEQFIDRVKTGREDRIDDIDDVAEGRVFSGRQAVENGLIDEVGGVETAIVDMADQLNLREEEYDILELPRPMSFGEFLDSLFGVESDVPAPRLKAAGPDVFNTARAAVGEHNWQKLTGHIDGITLLQHEPVLTIMPAAILLRPGR